MKPKAPSAFARILTACLLLTSAQAADLVGRPLEASPELWYVSVHGDGSGLLKKPEVVGDPADKAEKAEADSLSFQLSGDGAAGFWAGLNCVFPNAESVTVSEIESVSFSYKLQAAEMTPADGSFSDKINVWFLLANPGDSTTASLIHQFYAEADGEWHQVTFDTSQMTSDDPKRTETLTTFRAVGFMLMMQQFSQMDLTFKVSDVRLVPKS